MAVAEDAVIPLDVLVTSEDFTSQVPMDQLDIIDGWMSHAVEVFNPDDEQLSEMNDIRNFFDEDIMRRDIDDETRKLLPDGANSEEDFNFMRQNVFRQFVTDRQSENGINMMAPNDMMTEEAVRTTADAVINGASELPPMLPSDRARVENYLGESGYDPGLATAAFDAGDAKNAQFPLAADLEGGGGSDFLHDLPNLRFNGSDRKLMNSFKNFSKFSRPALDKVSKLSEFRGARQSEKFWHHIDDAQTPYPQGKTIMSLRKKAHPTEDILQIRLPDETVIETSELGLNPTQEQLASIAYANIEHFDEDEVEAISNIFGSNAGLLGSTGDFLFRGAAQTTGGLGGLLQTGYDPTTEDSATVFQQIGLLMRNNAEHVKRRHPASRSAVEAGTWGYDSPRWWLERGGETATNLVLQMLTGGAMRKGAGTGFGALGKTGQERFALLGFTAAGTLPAVGNTYIESFQYHQDAGLSHEESHNKSLTESLTVGLAIGSLERISGKLIVGNKEATVALTNIWRKIGTKAASGSKTGFTEGGTENLQEWSQILAKAAIRGDDQSLESELAALKAALGGDFSALRNSQTASATSLGFGAGAGIGLARGSNNHADVTTSIGEEGVQADVQPKATLETVQVLEGQVGDGNPFFVTRFNNEEITTESREDAEAVKEAAINYNALAENLQNGKFTAEETEGVEQSLIELEQFIEKHRGNQRPSVAPRSLGAHPMWIQAAAQAKRVRAELQGTAPEISDNPTAGKQLDPVTGKPRVTIQSDTGKRATGSQGGKLAPTKGSGRLADQIYNERVKPQLIADGVKKLPKSERIAAFNKGKEQAARIAKAFVNSAQRGQALAQSDLSDSVDVVETINPRTGQTQYEVVFNQPTTDVIGSPNETSPAQDSAAPMIEATDQFVAEQVAATEAAQSSENDSSEPIRDLIDRVTGVSQEDGQSASSSAQTLALNELSKAVDEQMASTPNEDIIASIEESLDRAEAPQERSNQDRKPDGDRSARAKRLSGMRRAQQGRPKGRFGSEQGSTIIFSEIADLAISAFKSGGNFAKFSAQAVAKWGNSALQTAKDIWAEVSQALGDLATQIAINSSPARIQDDTGVSTQSEPDARSTADMVSASRQLTEVTEDGDTPYGRTFADGLFGTEEGFNVQTGLLTQALGEVIPESNEALSIGERNSLLGEVKDIEGKAMNRPESFKDASLDHQALLGDIALAKQALTTPASQIEALLQSAGQPGQTVAGLRGDLMAKAGVLRGDPGASPSLGTKIGRSLGDSIRSLGDIIPRSGLRAMGNERITPEGNQSASSSFGAAPQLTDAAKAGLDRIAADVGTSANEQNLSDERQRLIRDGSLTGNDADFNQRMRRRFPRAHRAGRQADAIFTPISTVLGNIHGKLRAALRHFEWSLTQRQEGYAQLGEPYAKAYKGLPKKTQTELDRALFNGDVATASRIAAENGMTEALSSARKMFSNAYEDSAQTGRKFGFIENYWARNVKDINGLKAVLEEQFGYGDNSIIEKAIADWETKNGTANQEQKIDITNRTLSKLFAGRGRPSNMTARDIETLQDNLLPFYSNSAESMASYAKQFARDIETRSFFGHDASVKRGDLIEGSIGGIFQDLRAQGLIKTDQVGTIMNTLADRVNYRFTTGWVSAVKNVSYMATIGNYISTITQLGDFAWSAFLNGQYVLPGTGLVNSLGSGPRNGGKIVTREMAGVSSATAEFDQDGGLRKWMDTTFKLALFTKFDAFGKENLMNGWLRKVGKQSFEKFEKSVEEYSNHINKDLASIHEDIKAGNITEDIKFLAFAKLSDFQPVSLAEMPSLYLRMPAGRIFYMLKSFTIKQVDIVRREAIQKIAHGTAKGDWATVGQGVANLTKLAGFFTLAGAGADELKNVILGRDVSLKDNVINNIMKFLVIGRYHAENMAENKPGGLKDFINQTGLGLVPVDMLDRGWKTGGDVLDALMNGQEGDVLEALTTNRLTEMIPLLGKIHYWQAGGGKQSEIDKQFRKFKEEGFERGKEMNLERKQITEISAENRTEVQKERLRYLNAMEMKHLPGLRSHYEKIMKAAFERGDMNEADEARRHILNLQDDQDAALGEAKTMNSERSKKAAQQSATRKPVFLF